MPSFPMLQGSNQIATVGQNATGTTGTVVTSAGSINVKGSYAEIVSAIPFATSGFLVNIVPGVATDWLFDIAIGGAGSEKIVVENLLLSTARPGESITSYFFPIRLPEGVRLAMRCQARQASQAAGVVITLFGVSNLLSDPLSRCTAYGAATGDSGGIQVDPGGTVDTKGSYSEIVSSTSNPIRQIIVVLGDQNNAAMTTAFFHLDIAVGAAGSEKILIPDLFFGAGTTTDGHVPAVFGPFPVAILAGTRIAARARCSINDATDRLFDVAIYGVD
jgi:hypothetical protein